MIETMIERTGWVLIHSVWQASAAAAVLAVVLRVGKGLSASTRYLLACGAMLAVVGAAGWGLLPRSSAPVMPPSVPIAVSAAPIRVPAAVAPAPVHDLSSGGATWLRLMPWLVGLWSLGVLGASLYHLGGWLLLQRFRAEAVAAPPVWQARFAALMVRMNVRRAILTVTDRLEVPIVIGALRPMVLVPLSLLNNLSPPEIEAILAHELAHVRRHDYLVNLLQTAVETLLFYHPAVWWIGKQIRHERECCCDALAAEVCGDRVNYAKALAALEQSRIGPIPLALGALGAGNSELLARVQRILRPRISNRPARSWAMLIPLLAGIAVLAVLVSWLLLRTSDHPVVEQDGRGEFEVVDQRATGIDPEDFVRSADPRVNIVVRPGDFIHVDASNTPAPPPSPVPQAGAPAQPLIGEYYIGGRGKRTGVYSLSGRRITLRQAIIAAGGLDDGAEVAQLARRGLEDGAPERIGAFAKELDATDIELIKLKTELSATDPRLRALQERREALQQELDRMRQVKTQIQIVQLKALFDGTARDIALRPDDQIVILGARPATAPSSRPATADSDVSAASHIRTSDLVQVSIEGLAAAGMEQVKVSRVTEKGEISLPILGPIPAAGLAPAELELAIFKAYRDRNVVQNAHVRVIVVESGTPSALRPNQAPERVRVDLRQLFSGDESLIQIESRSLPDDQVIKKGEMLRIVLRQDDKEVQAIDAVVEDSGLVRIPTVGGFVVDGLNVAAAEQKILQGFRDRNIGGPRLSVDIQSPQPATRPATGAAIE
jgi:beta-lactamase regulating signal transducer with metallopeptidase domain/protein involved in polysaccharide export with SLBB domain